VSNADANQQAALLFRSASWIVANRRGQYKLSRKMLELDSGYLTRTVCAAFPTSQENMESACA
jgi:hypothetical protein